jgi:opacity protein-like surface antigen
MKTKNLMVLALTMSFASAYAQSDERVLNSDPINVDGYLAEDRPVTDGELEQIRSELKKQKTGTQLNKEKAKDLNKLTNQTEKLLESQDEYIDKKIESTQAIKEFNQKYEENQKKLRCIMEESNSPECDPYKKSYQKKKQARDEVAQEVNVAQAAPVVSTTNIASAPAGNAFEVIKLLPYAGGTSYNGKIEQLEAELAAGLRLESNVTSRFSMGIGFNFAQLKTNDFANNSPWMRQGTNYFGAFGAQGREIAFRTMGIDLYGKFFITQGERFRPYLGAGLGYNRSNMRYSENNPFTQTWMGANQQFGNEEYRTSYATGTLMAGSEIMITRGFGLNIEAAYGTGLGNSLSSESAKNPFNSPDQRRLRDLGDEIINANALSIFAGAVIIF